ALVARHGLMRSWKQGFATSMQSAETGYRISLQSGETLAPRNVVLALGSGDHLRWPAWATTLKSRHQEAPLDHIFDKRFHRDHLDPSEDVVIVGAGISAAQLALSLAKSGSKRRITLLARHSLRQADFESDPGWLGPLYLAEFDAERDLLKRRQMIDEARQLGSIAADVMQDLTLALRAGEVTHTLAHVQRAAWDGVGSPIRMDVRRMELDEETYHRTGEIVSRMSKSSQPLAAHRVVLATGFESCRPGGELVDRAIESLDLALAPDGFPDVDKHLRWRPGLFVMGPLAELVVGPASRNLGGARMAASRIMESPEVQRSLATVAQPPASASSKSSAPGSPLRPLFENSLEPEGIDSSAPLAQ
ncbi:MAG: SidA/IucD/PvdA family monooxygenase, partial [Planctomycetota bacterium]